MVKTWINSWVYQSWSNGKGSLAGVFYMYKQHFSFLLLRRKLWNWVITSVCLVLFIKRPEKLNISYELSILPLDKFIRRVVEVFFFPQQYIRFHLLRHICTKDWVCFKHFRWASVMDLLTFSQAISGGLSFSQEMLLLPSKICRNADTISTKNQGLNKLGWCNWRFPKVFHIFSQLIIG